MLKSIHPLLGPDLLFALASMGHGDELAVVDANFPAASLARRLIGMRGVGTAQLVEAILTVLPLDRAVPHPASIMRVDAGIDAATTAVASIRTALDRATGGATQVSELGRFEFYERASKAFAIVSSGERRLYGNVLLMAGALAGDG
ncbi:MAG TPA: RbsD/FucU domain-containing protein [Casimicrobiaceae bacterium]